jgi:hypothetical protein
MAWQDRLLPAGYVAPSGRQFEFTYEVLVTAVNKRTTAFHFPNLPGTHVQDLGPDGRRLAWRIYFNGADYDTEASAFLDAVEEIGPGVLQHPQYGDINAIPFGEILRRDDLVREAGQAVVDITLFAIIDINTPQAAQNPTTAIQSGVTALNNAVEGETIARWGALDTLHRSLLSVRSSELFKDVNATLGEVSQISATVSSQFNAIYDTTISTVFDLTAVPLDLITRVRQVIHLPATAQGQLSDRFGLFDQLLGRVVARNVTTNVLPNDPAPANALANDVMFAYNAVAGSCLAVANTPIASSSQLTQTAIINNNELSTREQAIEAINAVQAQFDTVNAWREANQEAIGVPDTGAAYQALQAMVAITTGTLLSQAFILPSQRTIILDRDRNLIELVAQLYGTVDNARIDQFINLNDLGGDEFGEIKAGRRIVYYT